MKPLGTLIALYLILHGTALAQKPDPNRCPNSNSMEEIYRRTFLFDEASGAPSASEVEIAKRRDSQYREQQFLIKANKLVESWRAFAVEYNEKGAFNLKKAKAVSDAFHDLEKTEGWPKMDRR